MTKFVTQPAVRDGHSPRAPGASDAMAIETVTAITGLIGLVIIVFAYISSRRARP